MLTISKPLSAGQARRYHAEEFQNARDNYYTEGDVILRRLVRPARRAVGASRQRA
jgi:hypothetical protein